MKRLGWMVPCAVLATAAMWLIFRYDSVSILSEIAYLENDGMLFI